MKEKTYFSSKELYFLPQIKKVRTQPIRTSIRRDISPTQRLKSIEQIMTNFTQKPKEKEKHSQSICFGKKGRKQGENLYDKYELLPKIMAKKYKKRCRK